MYTSFRHNEHVYPSQYMQTAHSRPTSVVKRSNATKVKIIAVIVSPLDVSPIEIAEVKENIVSAILHSLKMKTIILLACRIPRFGAVQRT